MENYKYIHLSKTKDTMSSYKLMNIVPFPEYLAFFIN